MTDKITLTELTNLQNETGAVNAINTNSSTLVTAVNNTLSRNGTSPNQMGANLDMNGYRVINLPAPLSSNDAARFIDIINLSLGTDVGDIFDELTNNVAFQYVSKSAAQAGSVPASINYIAITYPQGSMFLKRQSSVPSHAGYVQTLDGSYFAFYSGILTPEFFGAVGDDSTDCTAAFIAMSAVATALKYNITIRMLGSVIYRVWPDNTSATNNPVAMSFSQMQNLVLDFNGARIRAVFPGVGDGGPKPQLIFLSQCNETRIKGIWFLGDRSQIISGSQTSFGTEILYISASNGTHIDGFLALNGLFGVVCARTPGSATARSTGIFLTGHCEFTNTSYPFSCQYDGDYVRGSWKTTNAERSYYVYGVTDHIVEVHSTDPYANDINIACPANAQGENATTGIHVKYTNRDSTLRGVNVLVSASQNGNNTSTKLGTIDAEVDLDVIIRGGTVNQGSVFTTQCYVYSAGPVNVLGDAAHEINARVSGIVRGDVSVVTNNILEIGTTANGFGDTCKHNVSIPYFIAHDVTGKSRFGSGLLTHIDFGQVRIEQSQFIAESGSILPINYNMGDSKFVNYVPALTALSSITTNSDELPYFTGTQTANVTPLTSYMRTLLDDTDAATARATLGVTAGAGDVVGPGSATANGFAVYNGTTGKLIKDHAATIALASEVSGTLPVANGGTGETGTAWSTWTPTVTPNAGAITAYSVTATYKTIGKITNFQMAITITTNGTGSGLIIATLPNTPNTRFTCAGRNVSTGKMLQGWTNTSSINIAAYDNTYPAVSGDVLWVAGSYENN